jgi:thiamine-phosphate pyrophosphorylase
VQSPPVPRPRGLYAILDVDAWRARGVELAAASVIEKVANALLSASPSMLQLRAKSEGGRDTLALLRRVSPIARAAGVPLVANDRVDLALLASVDAVHVGQDDLPLADVRRLSPAMMVGLSTHDAAQLDAAIEARPSYVAFGPIFGTTSKHAPDPTVGLAAATIAMERARSAGLPLVGIGGITRENVASLVAAGVHWGAVISDLVAIDRAGRPDLEEIARRARALHEALS